MQVAVINKLPNFLLNKPVRVEIEEDNHRYIAYIDNPISVCNSGNTIKQSVENLIVTFNKVCLYIRDGEMVPIGSKEAISDILGDFIDESGSGEFTILF
jgi:hypothetical protein